MNSYQTPQHPVEYTMRCIHKIFGAVNLQRAKHIITTISVKGPGVREA